MTKLFKVATQIEYKKETVSTNVKELCQFRFFFAKLSRIDPSEKRVNILGGQQWRNFLTACSNLVTMAIYVVKQT